MKLAPKLVLSLSILVLLFGVPLTFLSYVLNSKIIEKEMVVELERDARHIMDMIDKNLYERFSDIQMMATDSTIRSKSSTPIEITNRLIEFRNTYKIYASLTLFDLNRVRIADTDGLHVGRQHQMTRYWEDVLRGEVSAASDVRVSKALKNPVVYFASPVRDEKGEAFSVVVARMPINRLYDSVKEVMAKDVGEIKTGQELEIDLISDNGTLIYSNHNRRGILNDVYSDWRSIILSGAGKGEGVGSIRHTDPLYDEEDIFVLVDEQGYLDFKGNGWSLITHIPTSVAFKSAIQLRNNSFFVLFLAIIFLVPVLATFARRIAKPVAHLRDVALKVGEGDFDTRIAIRSEDEIGELAKALNEMALNLKKTTVSVDVLSKEVVEHKKTEMELQKSKSELVEDIAKLREAKVTIRQLQDFNQLKDDFLNIAAHELKTPLTSIIGLSEVIGRQASSLTPEQEKYIHIVHDEGSKLAHIVRRILTVTRFESGRETINEESFDIVDFISSLVPALSILAERGESKLITKIKEKSILIRSDKERISQVVSNFVDNACKYGKAGQTIIISVVKPEEDWIKIEVSDQGKGISDDLQERLFNKFSQLEPSLDRSNDGMGLGLYISKLIVGKLGGRIGVESVLGVGSTFYFTLPFKEQLPSKINDDDSREKVDHTVGKV